MCKVCDAKAKIVLLQSQLDFRLKQHVLELGVGDRSSADRCEVTIFALTGELINANKALVSLAGNISQVAVKH